MTQSTDSLRRYKTLLDSARRLGRAMDLDSLMNEILNRAQGVMEAEAVSIFLPDPKSGDLILMSTSDRIRSLENAPRVPKGHGIAGKVFETKQLINIKDAQKDSRHYREIESQVGFVTRAMLTIPLLVGEKCLGVMQALNPTRCEFFGDECEEIFIGFGSLIVNALLRIEAQQREIERARVQQELNLASEIQSSFLPSATQRLPFCQVHTRYLPARVVGGDFYFFHRVNEHRLLMGLGDVTGKGVPAALTMARATAMIQALASQIQDDLGAWVNRLNRRICADLQAGRFIGITFLLADSKTNKLQICAAGEYAPLRFEEGNWKHIAAPNQLPLGILPSFQYEILEAELKRGEYWLLFSDGITEARNRADEELTEERFLNSLPANQTGARVLTSAVDSWREFTQGAPQHDDVSLLLLDWRGNAPSPDFELECCPENLCTARKFVESWVRHCGYDFVTAGQIVLACDEAASNIFRHGYEGETGPVQLHVQCENGQLLIEISDQAKRIDPEKIQGRDLADLRPGGLGTVILNEIFDTVNLESHDTGNRLILKKQLPE